jgi:hypothetical protein
MIDRNERMTYLDSRQTNELTKRLINSTLDNYKRAKLNNENIDAEVLTTARANALKNALFLKFTGIEFEAVFQSIYIDRKVM